MTKDEFDSEEKKIETVPNFVGAGTVLSLDEKKNETPALDALIERLDVWEKSGGVHFSEFRGVFSEAMRELREKMK